MTPQESRAATEERLIPRDEFGEPYGEGPHYQHGDTGQELEMRRRGQKVRFYDMRTSWQVGPEHKNVAPATAWALSNGYFSPGLAARGIFPRNHTGKEV